MLEFLLVIFIGLFVGFIVVLHKNKRALLTLSKELEHERKVSYHTLRDLQDRLDKAEELNVKYRRDISTLHTQRSDLQSEVSKLKAQANSKPARRAARKTNPTQKK